MSEITSETTPEIVVAGVNGNKIPADVHLLLVAAGHQVFCSQSLLKTVLTCFPEFDTSRWSSIVPIDRCFDQIRSIKDSRAIVILVSGDPLFYGLGKKLRQAFPDRHIRFLPAVSYMQSCFAHFGINWDDAEIISLHGRPLDLLETRLNSAKLFIFTDPDNSPDRIAEYFKARLSDEDLVAVRMMVGECIGTEKQCFTGGTVKEISLMNWSQPNCMIVVNPGAVQAAERSGFGLRENDISHSRGLITKNEVRAAVIHRLGLSNRDVFWDVGAGSGSISLEAARLFPFLSIYSIEKSAEQLAHIMANKRRYQCCNIHVVEGEAPDILPGLPNPDKVFIGGSGGRLEEILNTLAGFLRPEAIIVITAVLADTARLAPEILYRHGFSVDISLIQVTRLSYPEREKNKLNPIHIICGRKNP